MKKIMSGLLVSVFLASTFTACNPGQVNTAKDVFSKVSFYSKIARSFIAVAESKYADNAKVRTALEATRESLGTVESLVGVIGAGFDGEANMDALSSAVTDLITKVFDLMSAIESAKKASSTTTS